MTQLATNEVTDLVIPDNLDKLSVEEIAIMLGQKDGMESQSTGDAFARLSINHSPEDDAGNTLPRGHFALYNPNTKEKVFGKDVTMRVFVRRFMYSLWDNEQGAYSVRSTQQAKLNDIFPDNEGGFKCGKLTRKEIEDLGTESPEAAASAMVKCNQVLYGLVSIADGKTATGEESPVENVPVVFYGKGASFVPISQYFKDLDSKNLLTWNVVSKLHSVRHKNGATIYYSTNMTVSDTVDFSKEDKGLLTSIADSINSYNLRVSGEHTEASSGLGVDAIDLAAVEA
tara:strand:+ start:2800 stop:3654 length:855 start_codon:yes stop_codon:yes gene_type:complete